MSKRLQVLLDESEFREIREVARRQHVTVAEWVRQSFVTQCARCLGVTLERSLRLSGLQPSTRFQQLTSTDMLGEIERGYLGTFDDLH